MLEFVQGIWDLFWNPFCGSYNFGHYVPFLAVFFGINLLFGAWDGFYGKLYSESATEAEEAEKKWGEDTATLEIPEDEREKLNRKRWWNTRIREWTRKGGRFAGRVIACSIAFAFFFVPKYPLVPGWAAGVIALSGLLPASALFFMWRNNKGLKKIRAKENEIIREARQADSNIGAAEKGIERTPLTPPSQ